MKGKIAFVLGAATGYVLGSRAGRQRYEQIKRGSEALWNTAPVQKCASVVQNAADEAVITLRAAAMQAGKDLFVAVTRRSSVAPTENTSQTSSTNAQKDASEQKSTEDSAASSQSEPQAKKTEPTAKKKTESTAKKSESTAQKPAARKSAASKKKDGEAGS